MKEEIVISLKNSKAKDRGGVEIKGELPMNKYPHTIMQQSGKSEEKNNILITKLKPLDEDRLSISNASNKEKENEKIDQPPAVSFFQLFRFCTGMEAFLLFIGIFGAVGTAMTTPANVWLFGDLTKSLVDYEAGNGNSTVNLSESLTTFALWNSVLGVIMLVLSYISVWTFTYVASKQILRIRDMYLMSALSQEIGWYDTQQTGDFASRMAEDLQKLEEGIGDKVVQFAHFQFSFVGSLAVAFSRGYELAFVCLSSLPVTLISITIVSKISSHLARSELAAYGKAGSIAQEVISSIRTVIAFGGENVEIKKYKENLVFAKNVNIKRGFFSGLGFGLLWFFIYASYALAFWYGTGLIIGLEYGVDDMVTVFFCVMMASMNFGMASPYVEAFAIAKGAGAKVFSVIDRVPLINSLSTDGIKLDTVNGNLSFNDVHFRYPSRPDVTVLQGLTLDIKRGEKIALVGSSGCGKSTCIQLIQRFYDPLEGSVKLDGVDIKELNVSWLRSNIGVVGQEPVLFGTTILENIRYGYLDATREDIEEAAREANAHDFIMKLPQEYNTLVGERGAQLSGGQKQRIAIARALVRKPSILLLDEATSALDTTSEAVVQKALDKVSKGRTTVIVAHRLSTIRSADKIVVVKNGKIVEQGKHEDLMNLKGHYYGLVTAQLVNTEEDEGQEATGGKQIVSRMLSVDSTQSSIDQPVHQQLSADDNEVEDKQIPSISMLKILEKNKEEWPYIVLGCIGSVVMGFAMPVFAVLFGDIMGVFRFINSDPDHVRSETNQFCMYFVIAGVSVGLATFLQIFTFGIAGEKLTMRLRGMAFEAMVRQEVAWFDEKANSTGALCARLSGDAASVQGATGQRIGVVLQNIATLFLGMGLAFNYEWRLGLVTLCFTPIILIANYLYHRTITGENLGNQKALEKSSKVAVEAVGNIRTVAGLGQELLFHEQYMAELRPANAIARRNSHFRAIIFGMARSIMFFAYSTCLYYGGKLVVNNEMPFQNVFKVSQALIMGTMSIANAMAFAPNFQKGLSAAAKIFQLLERKPQIYDPLTVHEEDWVSDGNVDYRNITFFYPTRPNVQVLRGLNLKIKKGQTVALVGQSGCGKSTCVQLLERFYDPVSGTVNLDERDISSVRLHTLRAQLGIVSQEPVLFDRSIAENIAYGDNHRKVEMSDIIEVAKKANIHSFITSLPLGYNTPLGEKGTQLSGGQKQRVAIARALIRNPRVLLLDEATSALDTESEKVVQEALDKAKEGRTCITIAHRLSTIQDADVICVIHHGKISEMGTHSQLLSQRGLYYKLCSLQNG